MALPRLPQGVVNFYTYYENGTENVVAARPTDATRTVDRSIMFADDAGRTLNGSNVNRLGDRLYGGTGNDTISGFIGDDYLEGGRGADLLDGGSGHDMLVGGAGIDDLIGGSGNDYLIGGADADHKLEGGTGRDWLEGGAGFDDYYLSTADTVVDTISDADNAGRLFVDGVMIGGFTSIRAGLYQSTGGLYRMAVAGDVGQVRSATLYRVSDNKTMANIVGIQGPTVLGYSLPAPPAPPTPVATYNGGATADDYRGWYLQTPTHTQAPLTPGRAVLDAGALNDHVFGSTHQIVDIIGGTGNDTLVDQVLINAAEDAQQTTTLSGGAGSDFLYGTGGTFILDGGDGNDFISAARFGSSPIFKVYSKDYNGALWEVLIDGTILADVGALMSLTPVSINQAAGSYDTGLGRWQFYYRPIAETTSTATVVKADVFPTPQSLYATPISSGGVARWAFGAGGFQDEQAVTSYSARWTTAQSFYSALPAAEITLTLANGRTGVVWMSHVQAVPTAQAAQDSNTSQSALGFINAGIGNDIVYGGAGRDIVTGGAGDDRVDGAGGEDFIDGGQGNDFLVGGRFNDTLVGGADSDIIHGGGESDYLYGGAGDDYLVGDLYNGTAELEPSGDDMLAGEDGNDQLEGGNGNDVLLGGSGNDILVGGAGSDVMRGGAGDDILFSHSGDGLGNDDTLDGGTGNDIYVFDSSVAVVCSNIGSVEEFGRTTIDDSAGTDTIRTNFFRASLGDGIENLETNGFAVSAGNINLGQYVDWNYDARARYRGNELNNTIDVSNLGQLTGFINSFLGGVLIDGGAGADRMVGSQASDTYIVDDIGDVVVEQFATYPGDTTRDRIVTPFATTLTANIEEIQLTGTGAVSANGNASNNLLIGSTNSAANTLTGLTGDDTYRLGLNDSVIEVAGAGTDTVQIDGEATNLQGLSFDLASYANVENLAIYKSSTSGVTVRGSNAANILSGAAGGGLIEGLSGDDTIVDFDFLPYWDRIFQQYLVAPPLNRDHRLLGGAGNDVIRSMGGNDTIDGGAGNDQLDVRTAGSRTIVFGVGYGLDSLSFTQVSGSHTLSWTGSTDFSTLRSQRVGNTLQLALNAATDRLDLINYYSADPTQRPEFNQWLVGDQLLISRPMIDTFLATGAPGVASAASDFLAAAAAGTTISAGGGDDVLLGAAGADTLLGDLGNDSIAGGLGNDTLNGGDGADKLDGGSGNDQLTGGLGNDEIFAGAGDDVIHFNLTAGQDRIKNNLLQTVDGVDVLRLDASVRPVDVSISADNADGIVVSVAGGASITVEGSQRDFNDAAISQGFSWTAGDTRSTLDRIEFSDGTVWTHADIIARTNPRIGTPGDDILIAPRGVSMRIEGLAGNDTITGRDGADQLIGGDGYDQLLGGDNNDLLDGWRGWRLATREAGDDTLLGGTGADTLDGGTGADSMAGGAGNDTYVVDTAADAINEVAAAGTDTVNSSIDYVLGANLENLSLLGSIGLRGEGNGGANTIFGTIGNDTLIGGGGIDAIRGGGGNDLYIGVGDGDTFFASHHGGTDWSGALTVDNVAPSSAALGTLKFEDFAVLPGDLIVTRGTGLQADDLLIALRGTEGTVVIKNHFLVTASQRQTESSLQFADGYTLDLNSIDALVGVPPANGADLTSPTLLGTDANDNLIGTAGDDRILGFAGNDFLSGGAGADTLAGGTGDDYYFVDNANDYVYEAAGAGVDSINSSVTSLTSEVNLYLTDTSNINATGNAGANTIYETPASISFPAAPVMTTSTVLPERMDCRAAMATTR